jgi:(p)ppGpp synthase/HD superfamily hydrolase
VKTSRAKARIRAYIKAQQSSRSVAVGREIIERDLGRHQLDYAKLRNDGTLKRVAHELAEKDEDALLASVGYGKVTATDRLDCCALMYARMRAFARDVFTSFSQSFDGAWFAVVTISTVSPLCSW